MSESEKPLRQQIDDAMATIRQQLDRLREGPTMGGPSDDRSVIADLEAEYQRLKEARRGLGPHDGEPEGPGGELQD
jgi:hypothetical protein